MAPRLPHRPGLLTALAGLLLVAAMIPARAGEGRVDPPRGRTGATQPAPLRGHEAPGHGRHRGVIKRQFGEGPLGYWLFTPSDPAPAEAPVVLFLHGWRALNPRDYGGWIDHLARRGSIVIYPIFEAAPSDDPFEEMRRAMQATRAALDGLATGPIKPRLDRFAIVGHSLGGGLTPQIAARCTEAGLPSPRAIMPVEPGWRAGSDYPAEGLESVPATVLALTVIGADDQFARTRHAGPILHGMRRVPDDRKRLVTLHSDDHGTPPLVADHAAPLSPRDDYGPPFTAAQMRRRGFAEMITGMREGEIDALDYNGLWRLFDDLCDAAFAGKSIDAALEAAGPPEARDRPPAAGGPERLTLGLWSDGTPVAPMTAGPAP